DLGQAQQAETLLADVIARAGKVSMATLDRGEIHIDRARALVALERFDEARAEFEAAQVPIRAAAANDSPLALSLGAALADAERREGNGARARALLDPIIERQRRRDDRMLPESLLVAARIARDVGERDRAARTLADAAAQLERQGRPFHALAKEVALERAAL